MDLLVRLIEPNMRFIVQRRAQGAEWQSCIDNKPFAFIAFISFDREIYFKMLFPLNLFKQNDAMKGYADYVIARRLMGNLIWLVLSAAFLRRFSRKEHSFFRTSL